MTQFVIYLAKQQLGESSVLAAAHSLEGLLHSPNQFVIPLFQRFYVWEHKDWERLWNDIIEMLEPDAPREHFMGSLVCMQGEHQPGRVPQYLVIDGQQRLTTFVILLCALRDEAKLVGAERIAGNIQDNYLTHEYQEGIEHYRVVLRLRDRQTLFDLVSPGNAGQPSDQSSRIYRAYDFFRKQAQDAAEATEENTQDWLKHIFTVATAQLSLVMITLQQSLNENPFAIFETLNSTGQKLEEADLIRNHVFMHVPLTDQDRFDETIWQPFEDRLNAVGDYEAIRLTDFYRDFLMRDGQYVRPSEVYIAFRDQMNTLAKQGMTPTTLTYMLDKYARLYCWIHRPQTMPVSEISTELESLSRLRLTTAFPLILHLLHLYIENSLPVKELLRCLRAIESFAIRRSIAGESTRPYSRFFPTAIRELNNNSLLSSLVNVLVRRGWPDDNRFLQRLATFPIYRSEQGILRLLLLRIEEQANHKEPVDVATLLGENRLQIEHIMPQTIGDNADGVAWKTALGTDWQTVHSDLLHTLGNLTLTGYNPELSNSAFARKREEFSRSHLELNRQVAEAEHWDGPAIRNRGETLALQVAKLWPPAQNFYDA